MKGKISTRRFVVLDRLCDSIPAAAVYQMVIFRRFRERLVMGTCEWSDSG